MAMLPFRPTPFFANKNQAFWRLQAVGWGGAMLLRAMSSLANAQPLSVLVLVVMGPGRWSADALLERRLQPEAAT